MKRLSDEQLRVLIGAIPKQKGRVEISRDLLRLLGEELIETRKTENLMFSSVSGLKTTEGK